MPLLQSTGGLKALEPSSANSADSFHCKACVQYRIGSKLMHFANKSAGLAKLSLWQRVLRWFTKPAGEVAHDSDNLETTLQCLQSQRVSSDP